MEASASWCAEGPATLALYEGGASEGEIGDEGVSIALGEKFPQEPSFSNAGGILHDRAVIFHQELDY